VPEETTRATALAAPEEDEPTSSSAAAPPQSSILKLITLPSASEAKKTKVIEKEAKKRKASTPPTASEQVKKLKMAPLSSVEPIDVIPILLAPPTRTTEDLQIVPFGVEYVIPPADEDDEDTHSSATIEQMDEEIEIEADASLHQVSSRKPQPIR
jgi:hypothetical protein